MDAGEMLEISIIKVENPGCMWGRILDRPGMPAESSSEYEDLQVKMNLFYHEVNQDVRKIKPAVLEEGQLCVVFYPALKNWCRATVESLFVGTVGTQAMCFLVDYGERVIIGTEDMRVPLEKFLQLPFRVQRFKLARIHPLRLKVSISTESAEIVPSPQWDVSATKYLLNLIQVSTLVEAVFCETSADCTAIELYLTIRNVKICVNDDLVVKKFACFSSEKDILGEQSGSMDRSPVSLAWDIYSNPQQILEMNGYCAVRPAPPFVLSKNGKGHLRPLGVTGAASTVENIKTYNENTTCDVCDKDESTKNPAKEEHITSNFEQTEGTERSLAEQLSQKLNLIRFMKFLNPTHSNMNTEPDEFNKDDKPVQMQNDRTPFSHPEKGSTVCLEKPVDSNEKNGSDLSSTSDLSVEVVEPAFSQEPFAKNQLVCARLLQFLNPDPLNSDSESVDNTVVCCEPRSGVLVHSSMAIGPCRNLSHAPITEQFRKFLLWRKYSGPDLAERYCWPPVARGCDTVLCHSGNNPLSYIPPLLALLQLASVFTALTTHTGPVAVILCPGWEKVQLVLELLEESQAAVNLHTTAILLGLGKDEARNAKIQNNCLLLVTTPFSLARLLEIHCFLFLRLCHLVLDEASELFSRAPDQMAAILQHFQKVVLREERAMCPRQIIAVSNHWSQELEVMVREHMVRPCIIITVPEEAAVYGGVHQTILLCLDCNKISVLLSSLDFSPSVPQKTIIITNSIEEVEHVYKAVSNTAAFSLKAHEGLTYQFNFVVEQWKKDISPGTLVVLVTTNDCIKALGIKDATCVVHYGFPSSPRLFGNRLFCMSENFQNLSEKDCAESCSPVVRSVLLLSEQNARHVSGVLRYLKRTSAPLPEELLQFAQGVQQAKEEQKIDRSLCSHLKTLGFCRDSTVCPDRHSINKALDYPLHPDSGTILVLPLYIKSASLYYGRIVNPKEDNYKNLAAEMNSHYAEERLLTKEVVEGGLYAVQEEDVYHRVCLSKVPDKGGQLFSSVTAHFIDDGRIQEVKSHQLLQLPPKFQSLPGQAVEIILCRAKPIDGEMEWSPKVTRAISLKIKGKIHQAKVVMCLGNTIWVDPMIHMTRVPGLKTYINEYNVHTEILATGMGATNPEHLEQLRLLCQEDAASVTVEFIESSRCETKAVSLEQRVQAAEEALVSRMKAVVELTAECKKTEARGPSKELEDINKTTVHNGESDKASMVNGEQISADVKTALPQIWTDDIPSSSHKDGIKIRNEVSYTERSVEILQKSFHPQIKWFQGKETVTLKVKLVNPMMQKCEFFSDRVVYSAYMNSRRYYANLELYNDINAEQCSWEVMCNEPVIKLIKKEKGEWKSLLKDKCAFVSYDFDHIEDEDISASNGHWFLANTGEEGFYVTSESGSDSD